MVPLEWNNSLILCVFFLADEVKMSQLAARSEKLLSFTSVWNKRDHFFIIIRNFEL